MARSGAFTSRGAARHLGRCCIAAMAMPLLSACQPADHAGQIGLSVDPSGRPVAVVLVCVGRLDRLLLNTSGDQTVATLRRATPITGDKSVERVALSNPAHPWHLDSGAWSQPASGSTYELLGADSRFEWNAGGVVFTSETLRHLTPELVAYPRSEDSQTVLTSVSDMVSDRCF